MKPSTLKSSTVRAGAVKSGRRRIAGERTSRRPEQSGPPAAARPAAGPAVHEGPPPEPAEADVPTAEVAQETAPEVKAAAPVAPAGKEPSNLVLAVLAVVTAAVVAAAAYFAVPAWRDRAVEQAQQTAPSVAERAVQAILSYDYKSLGHDEKAAASYLTPAYAKKYENTFSLVKHNAPGLKAKVAARVLGSGVSEADPDHAHVLVFVDQTTRSTANGGQPQVALNRVMLDMVRQDGRWLVNGITSY